MSDRSDAVRVADDLRQICQRVRQKAVSYERYNFADRFNDFLKAFFDLAQEFDALDDFYRICVSVPLELIGVASSLYLCQGKEQRLILVCSSEEGVLAEPRPAEYPVQLHNAPYAREDAYIIPICSKQPFDATEIKRIREVDASHPHPLCGQGRTMGMYVVRPLEMLSESDKFFFVKYANRIGYNLDNRLMVRQNIDHLKFINTLVMDIEHNIIVPNMYFRHLFNQLRRKLQEMAGLKAQLEEVVAESGHSQKAESCLECLKTLEQDLLSYHQELVKHHSNTSLFLESLFRREHFERGHLVLHPRRCFVEKEVIIPQLEHFASRLKAADVTIERPQNMQDEEFQIMVDVGLLAQVYANLFSNAAKYTREVVDHLGRRRKAVAYGREVIDTFGPDKGPGIKFNVFTTGPHLDTEEGNNLYQEGARGGDSAEIPGTGHGLSFIRHVVEMHGGEVGYEPTPEGNNFYFILPLPPVDYPPVISDS